MCLLIVYYHVFADAPIAVAANREERYDRPTLPPMIQTGRPRVVCGVDELAGGTWLGVNDHGVLAAVTNRPKSSLPATPRSRGVLCRALLGCRCAAEATEQALAELSTQRYAGVNCICLDVETGSIIYGAGEVSKVDLAPGLHLVTNGDVNDREDSRQTVARDLLEAHHATSLSEFVSSAGRVCADPRIVIRGPEGGTVSSELVAVTLRQENALYLYSPGPPDEHAYADHSAMLREILVTDHSTVT